MLEELADGAQWGPCRGGIGRVDLASAGDAGGASRRHVIVLGERIGVPAVSARRTG